MGKTSSSWAASFLTTNLRLFFLGRCPKSGSPWFDPHPTKGCFINYSLYHFPPFGRVKDLIIVHTPDATLVARRDCAGDVKKLSARSHEYRLRVGSFRVLFMLEGDLIVVYAVKDRKQAYE